MTRARTLRFWLVATVTLAMTATLAGVMPAAAHAAAGTHTVSGTITTATTGKAAALDNVSLTFLDAHNEARGTTHTDSSGAYSATVPEGTYTVTFSYTKTDGTVTSAHGTLADAFSVTSDTAKNYTFGLLRGTVSSPLDDDGLRVTAEATDGSVEATTALDGDGGYAVAVPAGKYAVGVGALALPGQVSGRAYYSSGTSVSSAKTVSVGGDKVVKGIDISYKPSDVSVTIRDGKGKAVGGATALFYDATASNATGDSVAGWATVGSDGTLSPALPMARGKYRVAFVTGSTRGENAGPGVSSPPYMTTWHSKAASFSKAKTITVGAGDVSVSGTIPTFSAPSTSPFKDVKKSNQFYKEISWMHATGISEGWPDGTYKPRGYTDRNAMAAFLYRMAGEPDFTPPSKSPFRDVEKSDQFYKEITWLASTGITKGWPDGTYRPKAPTDRNAMAAFLYRMAGEPDFTPPSKSPFTDMKKSYQFYKEVSWMADEGLSKGWPDNTYRRKQSTDRNGIAAFIYRYMSNDMPIPRS